MKNLWEELYQEYYFTFDYLRKVKIEPKQINKDYGCTGAFRLNSCCPIVVKQGGYPLDVLAADLGFESSDTLYEHIKNYEPKYKSKKKLKEEMNET